jgi:hypothetical protein
MKSKITTAAILVFLALALGASDAASQCTAGAGEKNPDETNITKPDPDNLPEDNAAAVGGENEIWVYPKNDADSEVNDRCRIQWAVNNVALGGKVRLMQYQRKLQKAPEGVHTDSNFGYPNFVPASDKKAPLIPLGAVQRVTILRDVTIDGEWEAREDNGNGVKENKGATILGGNDTFYVGDATHHPSVTIENIRFDGASPGPIKFNAGHNDVISYCSIVNYKWGQFQEAGEAPGPKGAFPIIVHSNDGTGRLTGTFKIENNFIGAPIAQDNLNNLMHISHANFDLTVKGNIIEDAYRVAIAVFENIGTTTIIGNTIYKKESHSAQGAAISVGLSNIQFFSGTAWDGMTSIAGNTITVSSKNSYGIVLLLYPKEQYMQRSTDRSVEIRDDLRYEVSGNRITMNNAYAALACIGACSNTAWTGNTVTGTGHHGIVVTREIPTYAEPLSAGFPDNNRFESNDLKGFTAIDSQVSVDQFARNNSFRNDDYGPLSTDGSAIAGAMVEGDLNVLDNENFTGSYSGKDGTPPIVALLFGYEAGPDGYASEGNKVTALKVGGKGAATPCTQIIDENWEINGTTTNVVPSLSACNKMPTSHLEDIAAKIRRSACETTGGDWMLDANGQGSCACPNDLVLNKQNRCDCQAGARLDPETGMCTAKP